jgi:hypothetical protein
MAVRTCKDAKGFLGSTSSMPTLRAAAAASRRDAMPSFVRMALV